jgi:hypothetical protein
MPGSCRNCMLSIAQPARYADQGLAPKGNNGNVQITTVAAILFASSLCRGKLQRSCHAGIRG